jgi:endoglucanase
VPDVGRSVNFRIAGTVFKETYRTMMLGMYLWRCGMRVSATFNDETFSTGAACHTSDGNLTYVGGGNTTRDGTGGWHDAGDYNKYVVNSGVTVGLMLKAWEHFHFALDTIDLSPVTNIGQMPAYLAEIKWNLDWVAKMQLPDGKVSHKLSTINFGGEMMPEREGTTRYFIPWGTAATGSFVGMMAQAARLYAPYDKVFADSCLAKARRSWAALINNPNFVEHDTTISRTGKYENGDDADKRLWAATELWETTGEKTFLEYVEADIRPSDVRNNTEWANVQNLASLTYLNSKRAGRDSATVASLSNRLITEADAIIGRAERHGYGRPFSSYYWGANGAVASTAYTLNAAYRLTGDEQYRHAAQDALSYLLGRNYFSRSFVTQVGHNPPKSPHCRRSTASGKVWPGYLIGGPHTGRGELGNCGNIAAICWEDIPADYYTNEIAINWNSAMIYALAGVLPGAGLHPAPPYPGQTIDEVSVRYAAPRRNSAAPGVKITRVARAAGGRLDIPHGAKVYTLNGKLIAERKAGAPMPTIKRSGVFIVKVKD